MAIDLLGVRQRIAALKDGNNLIVKGVSGVLSVGEAMETSARPPWAFVGMASERAQPNRTQGVHDQRVDCIMAVLLCLAAERRDGAVQLTDAAETSRLAVIYSLAGWKAPGADRAFNYLSHRVVALQGGLAWIEEAFETHWTLRQ